MKKALLFAALVTMLAALTACPGVNPNPPPASPPPPGPGSGDTSNVYRQRADLDALAAELYAPDPARRSAAVETLFRQVGLAPRAGVQATADTSDYGASARQLKLIATGLETGSGTSLEAWAKQANALEYRRADGAPLDATYLEAQLATISRLETLQPNQRALALVAAISRKRLTLGSSATGHAFGDGELDALQAFLLNNSLRAVTVLSAQPGQLRALDEAAGSLSFFTDFYAAAKDILKDIGGGLERTKQAGEFVDCVAFILGGVSMTLKPTPDALWYKGVAGKPFQSEVGLEAGFNGKISDDDLAYYASLKCAPTANRRVTGAQVRWDLEAGNQHGELRDNEVTTDASGKAVNVFTTHDEDTPEALRSESTAIKGKVRVRAALFGLSKAYPYIEYRSISIANATGSTGTKATTELDVTYYKAEVYEGTFFWKWDKGSPKYYPQASGFLTWAPDKDGVMRVIAGSATVEYVSGECTIEAPKTVYDLAAANLISSLEFEKQSDGSTAYKSFVIISDQRSNRALLGCPWDRNGPTPVQVPASFGVVFMIPKGKASFRSDAVVPELKGEWTGVLPEVSTDQVFTAKWDWKRVSR